MWQVGLKGACRPHGLLRGFVGTFEQIQTASWHLLRLSAQCRSEPRKVRENIDVLDSCFHCELICVRENHGGLFDATQESVVIENRCPLALLAMDGQHGSLDLKYGDSLRFERGPSLALALPIVS